MLAVIALRDNVTAALPKRPRLTNRSGVNDSLADHHDEHFVGEPTFPCKNIFISFSL